MFQFVAQYATQEIIILMVAFMGWLWKKIQAQRQENELLREGIVAILHDRLYNACVVLIRQGYATVSDKNNIEHLAKPYFGLGGNGTGREIYEECMALPIEKKEE